MTDTIEAAKTEKGRAGEYRIFHVGKMAYTVERNNEVLGRFKNLSAAREFAGNRHRYPRSEG